MYNYPRRQHSRKSSKLVHVVAFGQVSAEESGCTTEEVAVPTAVVGDAAQLSDDVAAIASGVALKDTVETGAV